MSHRILLAFLAVLLICFSAPAQVAGPSPGPEESAARAAMRKKATDLLLTVASQVDGVRSPENRVRMASNAADLLWDQDEKRSRSLFAAVAEDIRSGLRETDSDSERGPAALVFLRLRGDTLARIVKHDPELALEFLRATRLPPNVTLAPYLLGIDEESLELRLAAQIAAKNPQLALKLGRESLAKGFSGELLSFLTDLRRYDKEKSLTFYKEIVDKLRSTDLAQERSAIPTAMVLVKSFEPPEADEQVYRDLLGIILTSALANGCSEAKEEEDVRQICYEAGSVFPILEKYYGLRAAPLKRWVADETDQSGWWSQVQGVLENGTVDEILALAPKHPEIQGQVYWAALSKARASGDIARARQIAAEFPDESTGRAMVSQIDRELRWEAITADKPSLVQQELTRLPSENERIEFLLQLATQASDTDRQAALGLLTQAGHLIDALKPGREQIEAQVFLALMYCSLKSDRAFAIIEQLIPRLNELVAAATTLDGFDVNYIKDGEWNLSGQGQLGILLSLLAENAGAFAALDFDRSVNLAGQMERPELRLMADLKIAQGILTNQIKAPQVFPRR
jgi:hypothetical protein